jgi:hypothetical protein
MFCENCGQSLLDLATVCPKCGLATGASVVPAPLPAARKGTPVHPLVFYRPVLEALDQGDVIRTAVVFALRAFGVLTLLGGLYLLIEILKLSFQLPTQGTIGGLLFAIVFAAAVAASVQILFYRAQSVRNLGQSPFTVIPIFSILFRAFGEANATFSVAAGVGGCMFIWLSGTSPVRFLPGIGGLLPPVSGGTFLEGLLFLVWAAVLAFVFLVGFYFLAEAVVVAVDIARNVRLLVQQGGMTGGKG